VWYQRRLMARPLRVAIAGGSGEVGRALADRLAAHREVVALTTDPRPPPGSPQGTAGLRWWSCDLTSVSEAEIALAGADVLVFLARASRPSRILHTAPTTLDLLLADAVARALPRTSVRRVVFFACGPDDVREQVLRASGAPLVVLRGGAPDPVAALVELVEAPLAADRDLPPWHGTAAAPKHARAGTVTSVQRLPKPKGWTARDVGEACVVWNATVPGLSVERGPESFAIRALGLRMLVLRVAPGASRPGSFALEVVGGALTRATVPPSRFEFREAGDEVLVALTGFAPTLPWPLYRFTHALAHGQAMDRFGRWLAQQPAKA